MKSAREIAHELGLDKGLCHKYPDPDTHTSDCDAVTDAITRDRAARPVDVRAVALALVNQERAEHHMSARNTLDVLSADSERIYLGRAQAAINAIRAAIDEEKP